MELGGTDCITLLHNLVAPPFYLSALVISSVSDMGHVTFFSLLFGL